MRFDGSDCALPEIRSNNSEKVYFIYQNEVATSDISTFLSNPVIKAVLLDLLGKGQYPQNFSKIVIDIVAFRSLRLSDGNCRCCLINNPGMRNLQQLVRELQI